MRGEQGLCELAVKLQPMRKNVDIFCKAKFDISSIRTLDMFRFSETRYACFASATKKFDKRRRNYGYSFIFSLSRFAILTA